MAVLDILGHMPKYGNLVPRLHIFNFFIHLYFYHNMLLIKLMRAFTGVPSVIL